MKRLMIAAAFALLTTAAQAAAPKLPEIFQGKWCADEHAMMERCTERDAVAITANGFEQDEISCGLVRLTPQKPSRRVNEYRATFKCAVADKNERRYYWIGFYDEDHRMLFMQQGNSTFTAVAGGKSK